ncbi:HEAT repeat domain-containing protein [Thermodesulfobacteriota bacterium]
MARNLNKSKTTNKLYNGVVEMKLSLWMLSILIIFFSFLVACERSAEDLKSHNDAVGLIKKLSEKNPLVRLKAANALGEIKDARAVDPLIAILNDTDPVVRASAVRALGEIKDARAVDPLIGILNDTDPDVRASAVQALSNIKDARAVDPLIGALKSYYPQVRRNAVSGLYMIGTPAVDSLIFALKDNNYNVRMNAANALGEIKDARAVNPLIAILKDTDPDVRASAVRALGNIDVSEAKEALHWFEADTDSTIKAFRHYTTLHPKGPHVAEAHDKALALRTDDIPFEAALKAGTEQSLKQFLEDFPGHVKEAFARQAIKDITEGRDIVDLLGEKKIEIETQGSGIQSVGVRIRKLVPYPITVRVPVGSYFVSSRQSAQNMVATEEKKIRLTGEDWRHVSISAACANRPKDIPGSGDTFTVQHSPHQDELAHLMPVLDKANVPYAVRQAAVWIVTDNADYDDLGILVSRSQWQMYGGRQINEYEAAKAMKICDEAGIDVTRKAIWRDRQRILSELKDEELKKWLNSK